MWQWRPLGDVLWHMDNPTVTMASELGADYVRYQATTSKLLPV
jgi:hypothetical protein